MLIVFTALLVASIAWSAVVYYGTLYGAPVKVMPAAPHETDALTQMQSVFTARAAEKINYESAYHFVDPSR